MDLDSHTRRSTPHPPIDPSGTFQDPDLHARLERFVGRKKELRQLLSYAEEARTGHGRLVLITGEPGIGKTRLATELAKLLKPLQMPVLWGRCWEGAGAPPFWPWIHILRKQLQQPEQLATSTQLDWSLITDLVHRDASTQTLSPSGEHTQNPTSKADRFRLLDTLARLLIESHPEQGLVIILDDIHWADPASLLLLDLLAGQLDPHPILVVATYRDSELRADTALRQHLSRVLHNPRTTSLHLSGFSIDDIAQILRTSRPLPVSPRTLSALHLQTRGNPFFLLELLRTSIFDAPSPEKATLNLPETIVSLINARLKPLSNPCRQLLVQASLIGPSFDLPTLAALSDLAAPHLSHLLTEACEFRLLEPTPSTPAGYAFSHAIIRDALYQLLSVATRGELHRKLASYFDSETSELDDSNVTSIAHHYFHALPQDSATKAKAYYYAIRAATKSVEATAYEDAVLHYQRALTLLPTSETERARCEVRLKLAESQMLAGDWQAAQATHEDAFALGRRLKHADIMARAAIGLRGMGRAALPPNQKAINALREAADKLQNEDPALRACVATALSTSLYFAPEPNDRHAWSKEARSLASKVEDAEILGDAIEAQILDAWRPDSIDTMLRLANELLDLGTATHKAELTFRARIFRYAVFRQSNDRRADAELSSCSELAGHLKNPRSVWQVLLARASYALVSGDLRSAENFAKETRLLGSRFHDPTAEHHLGLHLFSCARLQNSMESLPLVFKPLLSLAPYYPLPRVAFAYYLAATGSRDEAARTLDPLIAHLPRTIPKDAFYLLTLSILAATAYELSDRGFALQLLPTLAPYSDQVAVGGWGSAIEGSLAHFLGLLYATTGQADKAEACLRRAISSNNIAGFPLLGARSELALAALFRHSTQPGHYDAGTGLLQKALESFKRAESSARISQIEQLLTPNDQHQTHASQKTEGSVEFEPGDTCSLIFNSRRVRVHTTKGLQQLIYLIERPNHHIPALLLARIDKNGRLPIDLPDISAAIDHTPGEPLTDSLALGQYRQRIVHLDEELLEAQANNDLGRTAQLTNERNELTAMISQSLGLSGRTRRGPNNKERARISVRNNLTGLIKRLSTFDEPLARHLRLSINTGALCCYQPERAINWIVSRKP